MVKEQLSYLRSCDLGDRWNEVDALAESVNDDEDRIVALLGDWKLDDKVHRDLFPVSGRDIEGLKEAGGSTTGGFVSLASVAALDICLDRERHLGPKEQVSNAGVSLVNA